MNSLRKRVYEILELAEHGDLFSRAVDLGLVGLIFLNVLAVVFETIDSLYAAFGSFFDGFELFSVAVFSLEYLARVWSCVENPKFSVATTSSFVVRWRYVRSVSANVDLLAILPFYLFHLGFFSNLDMRFLRVVRLIRLFKLTRYSSAMTALLDILRDNARSFSAALTILMVVMLLAASGIYLFEHDAQPEAFGSIPAAMWWAFATLTTVGYGDVTPITVGGKVFGVLITVVGVGMVALPAGILASAFSQRLRLQEEEYRDLADRVYEDGVMTDSEQMALEKTRMDLGLNEDIASRILAEEQTRAIARSLTDQCVCPHCGGHLETENDATGSTVWRERRTRTLAG